MRTRHVNAFLAWISIMPTITVLQLVLGRVLAQVPPLLRPPIMATIAVPVMVYVLMPALHRRLHHRLHRRLPQHREPTDPRRSPAMSVIRTHHYTVDPGELGELLTRREALISAVRAGHPGLSETRLTRLDDGTFTDTWRWESAEQFRAARAAARTLQEAGAAMSLVRDHTVTDGEIVDER